MAYRHPEYLISPEALAEDLDNPNRRVFDTTVHLRPAEKGYRAESGRADYDAGHIPGAQFLDLIRDASDTSTGLGFSLPPAQQLESLFRRLGVGNDTQVVFYSTGHMMWATRAWWLAYYCGHENIAVLDGGFQGWQTKELPVTTEPAHFADGNFQAAPRPEVFVDRARVLDAIGDGQVCTINALSPEVFSGESKFNYGRKGHITGSLNLYYDELMQEGYFKDADALSSALAEKGLLDAPSVISYCGGGISATIDSFACLLVGQHNVAVYDGSMSEWVKDPALPMQTGA